ncbi:helicase associated domain-containing protein [Leifsonia sp. Leaf264]|uniref:helicase associated domain-containing protein n=1 Tax=Leifsonia sp. Leaf264 TaxID=1736314 RepID=UPI0006FA6AE6|nr:helicase associated domain-containing protein [Leifsonia sp. Leaf264]KQO98535.1 hypothetical protein ASF30_10765 [Leifsonia sp. Leaf264]
MSTDQAHRNARTAQEKEIAWRERSAQLAEFLRVHGRKPSRRSYDPIEVQLGEWLHHQRRIQRTTGLPDERWHTLDDNAPGWEDTVDKWQLRLEMLIEFLATEHRWPRQSENTEPLEHTLGNWLGRQRTALRTGELRESRLATLDERVPDWETGNGPIG